MIQGRLMGFIGDVMIGGMEGRRERGNWRIWCNVYDRDEINEYPLSELVLGGRG